MDFLKKLGITDENFGACIGPDAWLKTTSEGKIDSICPATGERIASVHKCSEKDYEQVVTASLKAFKEWRVVPSPKRGEMVRLMAVALREKKEELGALVSYEMGKIKQEGLGEVQEMIDMADFAVGLSRQLYGLTMHSERPRHRMYEQWHPLGPVGVISAFNFPVAVWSWNAFIAAVCGDTTIWKPSSSTPLCAIAVQNICNQVLKQHGCPNIFSLVIGDGRTVGEKMVSDHRVPLISFTGSTKMGKRVGRIVGERLGRTIQELGGNNAIILDRSADLHLAIPAILFGAVGTAGQRCTSTRRVFIPKEMFGQVSEELIRCYKQVKIGNPLDPGTLMGPLVNHAAVEEYLDGLKRVTDEGGKVLCGGKKLDCHGFFVEPTLVKAKNSYSTVQQEIFAPILYLIEYDTVEEAIEMQNAVPQGLSSALFTTNMVHAEKFLSHEGSDCGIANINIGTSGAEIGGAFGGEKETGGGREAGSDAWKAYMRRQTNTINYSPDLPLAQGIEFRIKN
jgi:aldehyde dehydrogenase (NAD+)